MKGGAPLESPEQLCKATGFTALLLRRQASKPDATAELLRTAGSDRVAAGLQEESAKPTLLTRATHADEDPIQAV